MRLLWQKHATSLFTSARAGSFSTLRCSSSQRKMVYIPVAQEGKYVREARCAEIMIWARARRGRGPLQSPHSQMTRVTCVQVRCFPSQAYQQELR
jgi:hypothetical protein